MKKIIALILLSFGLYAHQAHEAECPSPHHFTVGAKYVRANAKPRGFSSLSGNMGGMRALYEYKPLDFIYAGLEVDWFYGKVSGGNDSRKLLNVNVQERFGYTFTFWNRDFFVTTFSGFGYRYLSHDVNNKDQSPLDLDYNHFYVPVGILSNYWVVDWVAIGGNIIWKGQVFSSVYTSPLGGAYWKLHKKFKNVLVEFPLSFIAYRPWNFSVIFSPFFEFWQDGKTTARSPSGLSLDLPKHSYVFWGAELNFKMSF